MPNFHRISEAPWVHSFGTDWETQFTLHHHCDNKKECWNIQNGYKKTMKRVNLKTHCSLGSAFRCSWTQVREKEAKTILQFLYEAAVLNSTPFSFSYLTINEKMEKLCFSSTTYWVAIGESDFFFSLSWHRLTIRLNGICIWPWSRWLVIFPLRSVKAARCASRPKAWVLLCCC